MVFLRYLEKILQKVAKSDLNLQLFTGITLKGAILFFLVTNLISGLIPKINAERRETKLYHE